MFFYQQLTDKIDVIISLDTASNRPYDRTQAKRALRVYPWLTHACRVLAFFQPTSNGLVAINGILVLAWRNIDLFRDFLQKPRVFFSVNWS